MRRRVVITGLGVLSCAGGDVAEFQQNILRGICCLRRIEDPRAARLRSRYAGLIHGAGAAKLRVEPGLEGFDRFVHLALAAAREALAAAGVRPPELGRRMGLIFATCSGPMLLIEQHYERILRGDGRLSAEQLFAKRYHCGAKILAHALGVQGLSTTVVTACSASTAAIALAADLIGCGMLDAALAGGSDAFATSTLAGFEGLKATCEDKCAPFSKPFGLNLGEAAGFVFLEAPEAAVARGAPVQAQLLGSGMSNDIYHCSAPEPAGGGLASAMRRALANAGLAAEHVSYINAHGTGTEANDKAETKAIRKVFGPRAESVPVSSTKSMVGHCLGAAGVVEAIAGIVCARAGMLPPTANFTQAREGCALDCVPDAGRSWPGPRVFLSNNSAFGGHNASLVMEVAQERPAALSQPPGAREPIHITACGIVSSLGVGADGLREALERNRSGLSPLSIPGLPPMAAGLVPEAEVENFDRRLDLRGLDRSSRWATVAARAAIRESGFSGKPQALAELGLYLHLAAGPSWAESEFLTSFLSNHRQVRHISAFPYIVPSSIAGNVCRALRLAGRNVTLSAGPGAGLIGLALAVAALRSGQVAAILSGAVDELSERILADHHQAGLLCADGAAPPGEGAAVWMLETAAHAKARGAPRLAELCGIACSTETSRASGPDDALDALEATIRDALQEAGVRAEEVAGVCADAPPARLQGIAARICPEWLGRRVSAARLTGHMEGAQILADLSAARRSSAGGAVSSGFVLGVVSSPQGLNCAVVINQTCK
ncbi:MAG: beta-ketoacyl-[acyl-carrier-protein] synthase family protein [Verrucomicrobiota bacterium]